MIAPVDTGEQHDAHVRAPARRMRRARMYERVEGFERTQLHGRYTDARGRVLVPSRHRSTYDLRPVAPGQYRAKPSCRHCHGTGSEGRVEGKYPIRCRCVREVAHAS